MIGIIVGGIGSVFNIVWMVIIKLVIDGFVVMGGIFGVWEVVKVVFDLILMWIGDKFQVVMIFI